MTRKIPVVEEITKANDEIAAINRTRLDEAGVVALNLMASPGAGKTSLIERTVPRLAENLRVGVVGGDIATTLDAERAADAGAIAVQITTGGACHLDAPMVRNALAQLPLEELDVLVVENVGNLI
ncbi:MAG: hydrogenase nickel incorporation protein HypB, partial [Phycisphaerales bacterium]|nr:hydrogenase nickel incorporation protein HypB [Phycisphaerales bacterium]